MVLCLLSSYLVGERFTARASISRRIFCPCPVVLLLHNELSLSNKQTIMLNGEQILLGHQRSSCFFAPLL